MDADRAFDGAVLHTLEPTLVAAGYPTNAVSCTSTRRGCDLQVCIRVPGTVDEALRKALCVRVLDAIASSGQRFGDVEVEVSGR